MNIRVATLTRYAFSVAIHIVIASITVKSDAERMREYRARRKAKGLQDNRGNRHPTTIEWPFIGCDGEGGDLADRRHHYLMLRIGDDTFMHPDRSALHTHEILDFLCNLPRKEVINVAYFFDYDVTHILIDLPPAKINRLMNREARRRVFNNRTDYWPVDWAGFEFDYIPKKEFKVRRKGERRYFVINDVGSFFQSAFLKALQLWKIGTPGDWEKIAEGKSGRINFSELTDDTIKYNGREIVLLEQLMTAFRDATIAAGMVPSKWQGPGHIASSIYKRFGVIKGEEIELPRELLRAANQSYFGGRFETTAVGHIPGPVYQHDINSAYPYAETKLPCLVHGDWVHHDGSNRPTGLYLSRGNFRATRTANLYGLPVRRPAGSICWPGSITGTGWYWSHEINAAIHQEFTPVETWEYIKQCDCEPFNFIPGLYEERAKLGKEAKGLAIKLGLNSTYGKMCQSVGEPVYANPIYASLITSITRAQLYEKAVRLNLDRVIMLATDGIFTSAPHDRNHSPRIDKGSYTLKPLGEWDVTTYNDGIFVIQPGLYLLPDGIEPKTRGVPMSKIMDHDTELRATAQALIDELRDHPERVAETGPDGLFRRHVVPITLRTLSNLRLIAHTGKWDELGQWIEHTHNVSFDWRNKRTTARVRDKYLLTRPVQVVEGDNVPYSKDIGAMFDKMILESGFDFDPDMPESIVAPWEA